jgi:tetratricopeptide (TPR) repeat protein
MSVNSEPVGTLDVALAHTSRLLEKDPAAAAEQASEILKVVPGHPLATLLSGVAWRKLGETDKALEILGLLCKQQPAWAAAHYELGLTQAVARLGDATLASLRRAVELKPDFPDAWRALGDHLNAIGDAAGADDAYAKHIRYSNRDPRLMEAAVSLCENRIASAETLLRQHLKQHPTDVAAIRMLAEVAARLRRYADAEVLLERALELAPSFAGARHNYAMVLHRQNKSARALEQADRLLATEPRNPSYRNLKAAVLGRLGESQQAIALYDELLREYPKQAMGWMSYGHALKTAGRADDAIAAYRCAIELSPGLGEAYWSLANLKTFRFDAAMMTAMRAQLARGELDDESRFHFDFALGKALEDERDYEASFRHYEQGNALRRRLVSYDPDATTEHVKRAKRLFTREFFEARAGWGAPQADPIFVVGLPRSGSTLIEQILASHPLVEGTMELQDIIDFARELAGKRKREDVSQYPDVLASFDADRLRALGERYLQQTRIQRKTDAPFFVDKMPNNFAHTGLIHLILPNARIIDARRHPLGCCFSGYKQHFARGQHFTYGLADIGRYYHDYVELMAHFDTVLPGRVHRVFYERMVEDTEAEVRRLLAYCGLPFDERCLRFYENDRAVRTASSEQVRRPIYRDGVDHWQNYDPWLGPLKSALGPVLERYPDVPEF